MSDRGEREHRKFAHSSGHAAGIHKAEDFGRRELELKRQRETDLEQLDQSHGETVYRDKKGRKLDMLTEFMRQQAASDGQKAALDKAQYEWGKGSVQKKEAQDAQQELLDIASQPFARTIDDPKLEKMRKEAIREGDPMAEYIMKKAEKQRQKEGGSSDGASGRLSRSGKPLYKGPNPTPNRFGLRPGYRWDAIDRGNGFEKKILLATSEKTAFKEDEYKWSVSDM